MCLRSFINYLLEILNPFFYNVLNWEKCFLLKNNNNINIWKWFVFKWKTLLENICWLLHIFRDLLPLVLENLKIAHFMTIYKQTTGHYQKRKKKKLYSEINQLKNPIFPLNIRQKISCSFFFLHVLHFLNVYQPSEKKVNIIFLASKITGDFRVFKNFH